MSLLRWSSSIVREVNLIWSWAIFLEELWYFIAIHLSFFNIFSSSFSRLMTGFNRVRILTFFMAIFILDDCCLKVGSRCYRCILQEIMLLCPILRKKPAFNNIRFGLLFWGVVVCCFSMWSGSKYCKQMIIDSHQLSHYYNILHLVK